MGQTRGPSTRASRLDGRRARAQADETHAILALADIMAEGAPAGLLAQTALRRNLKLLQSCAE